jgi:hypothetical protein
MTGELAHYLAAFIFGAIIITLFSSRRLEALTRHPDGAEFQIFRLIPPKAFVGYRTYRRALFFYVVLLQVIFVVLCTSEPIAATFFGNEPKKEFQFNNVAWPLGAALILVGLIPATPLIEEIELALRRLAHRAAGIHDQFLAGVVRLERFEIETKTANKPDYAFESARYRKIHNILVAIGLPPQEAKITARRALLFVVFNAWTLGPQAAQIWSGHVRSQFDRVRPMVQGSVALSERELNRLIEICVQSSCLRQLAENLRINDWADPLDPERVQDSPILGQTVDERQRLQDLWDTLASEIEKVSRQLISIFVVLSINDRTPHAGNDEVLRQAITSARDDEGQPLYNSSWLAVTGGCLATLVIAAIFGVLHHSYSGDPIATAMKEGVEDGTWTAANLTLQFGLALMVVVLLRYSAITSLKYLPIRWGAFAELPIAQNLRYVLYAILCAASVNIAIYVLYQYSNGNLNAEGALKASALPLEILFMVVWSIVPAIFAVGCIGIADLAREPNHSRKLLFIIVGLVTLAAFTLIFNPEYDVTRLIFWINVVTAVTFSSVGLLLFRASTARQQPADVGP